MPPRPSTIHERFRRDNGVTAYFSSVRVSFSRTGQCDVGGTIWRKACNFAILPSDFEERALQCIYLLGLGVVEQNNFLFLYILSCVDQVRFLDWAGRPSKTTSPRDILTILTSILFTRQVQRCFWCAWRIKTSTKLS